MQITFYSVMMSLLCVSIAIIFIYFIRKNVRLVLSFDIRTIIFLYSLCILRICIPLEFKFTKVINTPFLYNWMFPMLTNDIHNFPFSLLEIILLLCGTVSIVLLIRLLYEYYRIHKILSGLSSVQNQTFIHNIKDQYPEFENLENILISPMFQTPMQIGFWKPVILLPDHNFDENDLYYILKHEQVHFENRDTWIKLLINLWKCLFWWFPFTYLLCHGLDESLEVKCDLTVIDTLTSDQKKCYMDALLHVYETQPVSSKENQLFKNKVSAFYQPEEELIFRFQKMQKPAAKNKSLFIFAIFCALFISSYSFVFQAYGQPEYENDSWTYFSSENTYIILNSNGIYHLYVDDQLEATLDENSALQLIKNGISLKKETR